VRNIIFDLDGTLVDSLPGIDSSLRSACNEVLPGCDIPPLRKFIGAPLPAMLAAMWPDQDSATISRLVVEFRRRYQRSGWQQTLPFEGVAETLPLLRNAGHRLFVLTNKPSRTATLILEKLGWLPLFQAVISLDSSHPPFACKQDSARFLLQAIPLDPLRTVMVGDGADDCESAAACGFRFIAAAYGYGSAADLCEFRLERFADLNKYLLGSPAHDSARLF